MNVATLSAADGRACWRELEATLADIGRRYSRAALASSLSAEDMVIADAIAASGAPIEVFVIDTGRLHAETLAVLTELRSRYALNVEVLQPQPDAVAEYVERHGANAFYESVDLRKRCCHIRKVEPLQRALAGRDAWLTGQRRGQGSTRTALEVEEVDAQHGIAKFNPLAAWSDEDVWFYVRTHDVPVNALHARGYPSIGCEPCTRAIRAGEDPRAGRWWWENSDSKECGLHVVQVPVASIKTRQGSQHERSA
jgi:phosphoadenosine phosphosulfate reductase